MPGADTTLPVDAREFRSGTFRGADGFFRAAQDETGRWWLLDPNDRPFFLRAVNGVRVANPRPDGPAPHDASARLRAWGFNALGLDSDDALRLDGLPFLAAAEFSSSGPVVVGPRVRLPDVFDPDWPRVATAHAAATCGPLSSCRELLGWVTDSAAGWAHSPADRWPSLLQVCLSLEPGCAAYHAAWEFVLALHRGRLDAVERAWGVRLPNRTMIRELTRHDARIISRGYSRDDARWVREYATRYFNTTVAAIRAADPHHLVFGCRFDGAAMNGTATAGEHVLRSCAYPAIDVAMPDWRELPADPLMPVLAMDVDWTTTEFQRVVSARDRRLTSVERMLRRGRLALKRLATHPAVVGYVWGDWQDRPCDQPPFGRGLVHVNEREAREHTEMLADFNQRAETIRGTSTTVLIP